ncbi:MAG: ABC transporter substrate-binding protein [Phycisphaerae bacterium]
MFKSVKWMISCITVAVGITAIANAQDTGPIVIGHYASMTGSEATFGVSTDNGIKLAVEEINAAGGIKGRQLKLITYDNQGKAQEAATVVTRLITQDKVVAILGEVASSRSIAGGQIAQRYSVPMITPSSTNPAVTEIGEFISRICYTDDLQGKAAARFAFEHLKVKNAAVLFNRQQAYSKGLSDEFKKAFTKMGGKVTAEQSYGDGDSDWSAQIGAIRNSKPDAIFIPGYYNDAANIAIQMRKAGVTAALIGGDGWDSVELGKIGGAAVEGAYFCNHYAPDQNSPEVTEFVKKYKAKHGEVPDALAALGYDVAKLLADAIGRSKSLGGKDLAASINTTKDFKGVTGSITIDEERNAVKPLVMVQVKGGMPAFVTMIDASK